MLVDEYQDSNVAQYLWLRLLAQGKPASEANICVVGDDDQSIYGWRGAEVDNILRFEKDFPGAKVIKLERNYRSTANILAAASHLIAYNEGRLGKTLQTDVGEQGELVVGHLGLGQRGGSPHVGEEIEQLPARRAKPSTRWPSSSAPRTRCASSKSASSPSGLNYRVIGGPRFYERKEIRDAIAYLRAGRPTRPTTWPSSASSTCPSAASAIPPSRCSTTPRAPPGCPLLAATRMLVETEELKPKQRTTLRELVGQFDDWADRAACRRHRRTSELRRADPRRERLHRHVAGRQIARLARAASKTSRNSSRSMEEFETLGGFLEHISLVMDRDTGEAEDAVSIMTLHSRQGPRIRHRLPARLGGRPVPQPAHAWTKAAAPASRKNGASPMSASPAPASALRLSVAQNRRIHGLWQSAIPSRFLDELPRRRGRGQGHRLVLWRLRLWRRRHVAASTSADPFESVYETPGWQRARAQQANRKGGGPLTIDGDLVARSVDLGSDSSAYRHRRARLPPQVRLRRASTASRATS